MLNRPTVAYANDCDWRTYTGRRQMPRLGVTYVARAKSLWCQSAVVCVSIRVRHVQVKWVRVKWCLELKYSRTAAIMALVLVSVPAVRFGTLGGSELAAAWPVGSDYQSSVHCSVSQSSWALPALTSVTAVVDMVSWWRCLLSCCCCCCCCCCRRQRIEHSLCTACLNSDPLTQ